MDADRRHDSWVWVRRQFIVTATVVAWVLWAFLHQFLNLQITLHVKRIRWQLHMECLHYKGILNIGHLDIFLMHSKHTCSLLWRRLYFPICSLYKHLWKAWNKGQWDPQLQVCRNVKDKWNIVSQHPCDKWLRLSLGSRSSGLQLNVDKTIVCNLLRNPWARPTS